MKRAALGALLIVSVAASLAGCDAKRAEAQCELDATRLFRPDESDTQTVYRISNYVSTCMRAKGYRLRYTVACMTNVDSQQLPDCYEYDFGPRDMSQSSAVAAAVSAADAAALAEAESAVAAANSAAADANAAAAAAMSAANSSSGTQAP